MICDRYFELISAEIDGELTDIESDELHAHISECSTCRATLEKLRIQQDLISKSHIPDRSREMRDKIKQAIGIKETEPQYAVWHVGHIPERIIRSYHRVDARPTSGPILGPMGRA